MNLRIKLNQQKTCSDLGEGVSQPIASFSQPTNPKQEQIRNDSGGTGAAFLERIPPSAEGYGGTGCFEQL